MTYVNIFFNLRLSENSDNIERLFFLYSEFIFKVIFDLPLIFQNQKREDSRFIFSFY